MIGKLILHYKIIEKLGEGGMGVVYLAKDTKLDRQVAIKFLPHHIAVNSDERKRFEIEAKAAAALNHNNIATIHAIEEVDDDIFLVMEYISGKHLKDHINSQSLPEKEAVNIAIKIAEGLQAAHKKGIVHRDIKSANIMSDDDRKIKIMDFGLAKFAGSAELTQVGTTLGTAAYMSPEQAKGGEVDQRADIWSLGVVLYEMLTGTLPFKGDYEQAVIFSILNEDVHFPENISQKMKTLLHRALAKDRSERYQSVDDLLKDLKEDNKNDKPPNNVPINNSRIKFYALSVLALLILVYVFSFLIPAVETSAEVKRIAVLPLKNLGSSEQDYFADGLTGEITSELSSLSGLGVIARSSAMQYKDSTRPLAQIAEELGVQYILTGTVQWQQTADGKKRVRVNPELIEIESATQIWSKPYESNFSSVFELQADIAATVASALNLTLIKSEKQNLNEKITDNPEAYDLYLKALVYSEDITNEKNSRIAEQLFMRAIDLDDNFAAAYAGLSSVQSDMHWQYFERSEENLTRSNNNALKAISLAPNLPAAHVAMGDYFYHGRLNYVAALEEYNKALKLQPNNVDANNGIGFVLRRQGKMQDAISYFKMTFELDPLNYTTVWSISETYFLLKEYEKGMPFLDKAISIAPDGLTPILLKSWSSVLFKGDTQSARNILLEAQKNKIGTNEVSFKYRLYLINKYEGKFQKALAEIAGTNEVDDQFFYKPQSLLEGLVYSVIDNKSIAQKKFASAITLLQQKITEQPSDSRLYSSLGLAYAGLGNKAEAMRQGKKGFELLPIEREAWRGSFRLLDLAQIYTMIGEHDLALEAIEKLLSSPTDALSVWLLKLDPLWDPLRGNARFEKIINNSKQVVSNDR